MASLSSEDESFIRQLASSNPSVRIAELNALNERIQKNGEFVWQYPANHPTYVSRVAETTRRFAGGDRRNSNW